MLPIPDKIRPILTPVESIVWELIIIRFFSSKLVRMASSPLNHLEILKVYGVNKAHFLSLITQKSCLLLNIIQVSSPFYIIKIKM